MNLYPTSNASKTPGWLSLRSKTCSSKGVYLAPEGASLAGFFPLEEDAREELAALAGEASSGVADELARGGILCLDGPAAADGADLALARGFFGGAGGGGGLASRMALLISFFSLILLENLLKKGCTGADWEEDDVGFDELATCCLA